jgi:transcriptional regulator with XRE-family HTH domain
VSQAVGDRIRALRQRKGWTLKDLAGRTNLSVPYLSDLERRMDSNPTLETLTVIADALGCPVAELMGPASSHSPEGSVPDSLRRFIRSEDFSRRVERIAQRTERTQDDVRDEIVSFLGVAPKRSTGELTADDWRRLLDVYSVIVDE